MREQAPVYHNAQYGFHALTRYQDVLDGSLNWKVFSSAHGQTLSNLTDRNFSGKGMIISMDPPVHDRYRGLVGRAFTPRGVARMESVVREVIASVVEPLVGERSFDAVADFSALFPVEIITTVLGVPKADRQQVRLWGDVVLYRHEGSTELNEATVQAYADQMAYFLELTADRRKQPADDMISHLIQPELVDEDGQTSRMTDEEVAGFAFVLGVAGAETVTKLVGSALVLLNRSRDQWRSIVDDRSRMPLAVEESMRYWPPSHRQGRITTTDITLHGVTIPEASPVYLMTGGANRDPRAHPEPDTFDLDRKDLPAPLTLGFGVHYCLGPSLGRLETRTAVEQFVTHWPDYDVDESGLRRVHMANVAGYSNVPVTVGSG
jgi:cytochrome P450